MTNELPFDLRYYKQINGGKHRAVNAGVQEAKHRYILILDSDDYLTDDAIEKVHLWIRSIENDDSFAGVSGLKGWINSPRAVGGRGTSKTYTDAKYSEKRKYHLTGDKAEVYRTDLLRKYPFPEFAGEKFLSEHVVWDRIAKDGYKLRWFNDIIYKCEYLDDGLTRSSYKLPLNNFQGFTLSTKIKWEVDPFPWNFFSLGLFCHVAKLKGYEISNVRDMLQVKQWQLSVGIMIFKINEIKKRCLNR